MSNYHLEVSVVSRKKGRSIAKLASYISGESLYDAYKDRTHHHHRQDVLYWKIFQPDNVPSEFYNLQSLCDAIEGAETRYDARLAREFIGSLPNELPTQELIQVVNEFIITNFIEHDLCAIAAIHEGRNERTPEKSNPHVHIIVPTRTIGPEGFHQKKDREHDRREYITIWREQWAFVQNQAYERNGVSIRVSHESLKVQGENREPTNYLYQIDWKKEQRGERTLAGDKRRAIQQRNQERVKEPQRTMERELEIDLCR